LLNWLLHTLKLQEQDRMSNHKSNHNWCIIELLAYFLFHFFFLQISRKTRLFFSIRAVKIYSLSSMVTNTLTIHLYALCGFVNYTSSNYTMHKGGWSVWSPRWRIKFGLFFLIIYCELSSLTWTAVRAFLNIFSFDFILSMLGFVIILFRFLY